MDSNAIQATFVDNKGYSVNSKQLKEKLINSQIGQGLFPIIQHLKLKLLNKTTPPISKILIIRFIKETMELADYKVIKIVETEILPILMDIGKYKSESQDEDRGKTMFLGLQQNEPNKNELQQIGHSILKLNLELLHFFGTSIQLSPFQYFTFPSMFSVVYKHLLEMKVKFPATASYVKPTDIQKFNRLYKQYSNQKIQQSIIEKFLQDFEDQLLVRLEKQNPDVAIFVRLASTGDSNLIQQIIDCLFDVFEKTNSSKRIKIIQILNELFLQGEAQIINLLRISFVPTFGHLVSGLKKGDYTSGIEHSTNLTDDMLRRFAYETLLVWENISGSIQLKGDLNLEVYSNFLPQVRQYIFFNIKSFKQEFTKNCKWRQSMNRAKIKPLKMQNSEEADKINSQAKLFAQAIKTNEKHFAASDFIQSLQVNSQTNIEPLPRSTTDKYVPMINRKDVSQKPNTLRIDNTTREPQKIIQKDTKRNSNPSERQMPNDQVVQKEASVKNNTERNFLKQSNASKQVLNNQEQEKQVEQPKLDSKRQSRQQIQQSQNNKKETTFLSVPPRAEQQIKYAYEPVIKQIQKEQIEKNFSPVHEQINSSPSEKEKTKEDAYIVSKNALPHSQYKVEKKEHQAHYQPQSYKPPRAPQHRVQEQSIIAQPLAEPLETSFHNIQETQRKIFQKIKLEKQPSFLMATSSEQFKLASKINFADSGNFKNFKVKNSSKHLNTTIESSVQDVRVEIDKAVTGIKLQYEGRIKDLQRKLQQMSDKEKNYIKKLNHQDNQIKQLKDEVAFLSKSNSMVTNRNQIEYLMNQNSALKFKLSSVQNSRNLIQSQKKVNTSQSFFKLNLDKPIGVFLKCAIYNIDVRLKKCLLRNKQILHKNSKSQIGIISSREGNTLNITMFYTFYQDITRFRSYLKHSKLPISFEEKMFNSLSANKQEKQYISMEIPKHFQLSIPTIVVEYTTDSKQEIQLQLPVSLVKVALIKQTTKLRMKLFSQKDNSSNIYFSEQLAYSKKIIKDIHSLPQFYPQILVLNPEDEGLFNDKQCNMIYGYQMFLGEMSFLIQIVLCPFHTLYMQGIASKSKDVEYLEKYFSEMLSVFGKER